MLGKVLILSTVATCTLALTACRHAPVTRQPSAEPAYACRHATANITVDSRFDEPDWRYA